MKTIWKYEVSPEFSQAMPKGAQVLSVQVQNGQTQMWALVDPSAPKEQRHFKVYGTGHDLPDDPGRFIGTFQMHGGMLVFHVFESSNAAGERIGGQEKTHE